MTSQLSQIKWGRVLLTLILTIAAGWLGTRLSPRS